MDNSLAKKSIIFQEFRHTINRSSTYTEPAVFLSFFLSGLALTEEKLHLTDATNMYYSLYFSANTSIETTINVSCFIVD